MVQSAYSSATANVHAALQRIAARDARVRAWLHVDDVGALASAQALDAPGGAKGPLAGLCVGVKDVIAVAGLPLTHNSPLFTGFVPSEDAACVATLRAAGAVILGKTDTTEFAAAGRNAVSANPHDLTRTPGGSSAGSAAAVADGHVPLALATQTGGSTIRPASFCGIHGFKPTWGLVSREGVKMYANSLDTVGWYTRDLDLCDKVCAVFGLAEAAPLGPQPLRIGVFRTPWWDEMTPGGKAAFDGVAAAMARAGVVMVDIAVLPEFEHLNDDHRAILFREGAAAFLGLARSRPGLLHADFHLRVDALASYPDARLREAHDRAAAARAGFERAIAGLDAVLAPSAPGIAPLGRSPGEPKFNQPWTLLHAPVVNLPLAQGEGGMPIGVSLVAPRYADRRLVAAAREIEERLGAARPSA
ncbi:amidase [Novosphingobium barchaimii LL02]|uniref:Amidase n=1 Tax=Novosphingobium barchaimii LL02 TaxID=1114963 RepID=A0A0J8A6X0_9SPHN|nr:amidase [Novosphingobium barchaimii]KMS51140.1 amidase [Novosphingobium barchaimii LL02]